MQIKKIGIILLLMILIVPTIALAYEFDNIKSYNSDTKEVTIKNSFLGIPTSDVAKVQLNTPLEVMVMPGNDRKVAEFTIDNYENDYQDAIKNIEVYDNKGNKVEREFVLKYKTYEDIEVLIPNKTKEICNKVNYGKDLWEDSCEEIPVTYKTKKQQKEVWLNFNNNKLPIGEVTIGLFTKVYNSDYKVEWIPTLFGVKINEWSSWTSALNIGLVDYWSFDTPGLNGTLGRINLTLVGAGATIQSNGLIGNRLNLSSGGYVTNISKIETTIAFPTIQGTRPFSVNLWVYAKTYGGTGFFSYCDAGPSYGFNFRSTNGANIDIVKYSVAAQIKSATYPTNSWNMLTAVQNLTAVNYYLNGVSIAINQEASAIGIGGVQTFRIGGSMDGGANTQNEFMDEIGFWNRSLTDTEVTQLYNGGTGITYGLDVISVSQSIPTDNQHFNTTNVNMVCNYTTTGSATILNTTLKVYNSSDYLIYNNFTTYAGNSNLNESWNNNFIGGTYKWECFGSSLSLKTNSGNRTFFINYGINITQDYPPTMNVSTQTNNFYCNFTTIGITQLNQETLRIYNASNYLSYNNNLVPISLYSDNRTWTTTLPDGVYNYSCSAAGTNNNEFNITTNRTFTIDTQAPTINITAPTSNQIFLSNVSINLNYTILHNGSLSLGSCWYSLDGVTSSTFTCGINQSANLTNNNHNLIYYANDSLNNVANSQQVNFTIVDLNYSQTFTNLVLESQTRYFNISILKNASVTSNAFLNYRGTMYAGTESNVGTLYTYTTSVPGFLLSAINTNYTFNWTINLSGTLYNSSSNKQEVYQELISQCDGANFKVQVINVTFADETTLLPMNVTMDLSNWVFGSLGRTYTFSNVTNHNYEYDFCIFPSWSPSIQSFETFQYSHSQGATYPQRKSSFNATYLNTTIVPYTLYLLSSTSGQYVSFQVINMGNQVIPNAYVKIERSIMGSTITISEGYTDASGIITFWLNPLYVQTLTISKDGYTTLVQSITPTQTFYTVTLGSIASQVFTSNFYGMTWKTYPPSGKIGEGMQQFTFNLSTVPTNLINNCTMKVLYPNGTIINSTTGCGSLGGVVSFVVNTTGRFGTMYGHYSFTANGTEYYIERDAQWKLFDTFNSTLLTTMQSAFQDAKDSPDWGGCPGNETWVYNNTDGKCYDASGIIRDGGTADYSRIVFFFLFFCLLVAVLNFYTGYDTAYPGSFIYILTGIVLFLSVINGTTHGFFALEGAVATNSNFFGAATPIMDNFLLAFHCLLISGIYFFTMNRRYQT